MRLTAAQRVRSYSGGRLAAWPPQSQWHHRQLFCVMQWEDEASRVFHTQRVAFNVSTDRLRFRLGTAGAVVLEW